MASLLQNLAKALGKSEDEIAEALAKKASKATESASEGAILKNLQKEASDIRQPLGSGKNLDALQRAASEAPDQGVSSFAKLKQMQEQAKNAPFVDTERNLPNVGFAAEDAVTGGPLARRVSTEATEVIPAKKAFASPKSEVLEAELVKKGMNPKLAKIAIASGLIGGGAIMLGGGDQEPPVQVPFAKEDPKNVLPDNYMALAQDEANSMGEDKKSVAPKQDGKLNFDDLIKKSQVPVPAEPEEDEFEKASNEASDRAVMAMLGKAASQIGGGIASLGAGSQVKIDDSGFGELLKRADQPVSRLKEKQAHEKAKAELSDEKAMRDPNSEISRMVTGIAQKVGLLKPGQTASAMALKNSGVNLGTLLATIEAGNARRDAAALSRDLRSSEKETAREFKAEEDRKKREDKRKLVTEEIESRKRTISDNIKRVEDILDEHGTLQFTGPEGEMLQGMLDEIAVDTAKLQDPDSVARPAEVQLVRQNLVPESTFGRATMTEDTAKSIINEFKKRIDERAATGYKVRGIDQPSVESSEDNNFPRQVRNDKGQVATVQNAQELKEARDEGFK